MKPGWRTKASDVARGAEKQAHKLEYAAVGVISLVVFFTFGFDFFAAGNVATLSPTLVIAYGVVFYAVFYLWLFALAKIVYPRIAFQFALGLAVLYFVTDVLFPPYFVTPAGQILASGGGVAMSWGASDILEAEVLHVLGIGGPALFIMTYVVVPAVVMFLLVPLVWSSKRIATELTR